MTHEVRCTHMRFAFYSTDNPAVGVSLEYGPLVDSIIDSLADQFEKGVLPIAPREHSASDVESLEGELQSFSHKMRGLQLQQDSVMQAITSGSLSEPLLRDLDARYTEILEQIAGIQSEYDEATVRLERAKAVNEKFQANRRADDVLYFVSGLRDPYSSLARQFFHTCVEDLQFRMEVRKTRERVLCWSGRVSLSSGPEALRIRFSGEQQQTLRKGSNDGWVLMSILGGEPLHTDFISRSLRGGAAVKVRPRHVLPLLGLDRSESWILHVGDSLLLRCYLALYSSHRQAPAWRSLETEIQTELGSPEIVMRRLHEVHDYFTGLTWNRWSRPTPISETRNLIRVATGESVGRKDLVVQHRGSRRGLAEPWIWRDGNATPSPCPQCSSIARARMTIREPVGYLCLDCRNDSMGIRWPSRFDQFIAYPELWTAAGFILDLPQVSPSTSAPRRLVRREPRLASLSEEAIQGIVQCYQDGMPLARIIHEFGLKDTHDVYALLDRRNVGRRRAQKRQRPRAS